MEKTVFALSLGFAGLIFATHEGWAQSVQCAARDQVLRSLANTYGETRRGIGLAADAQVMELFASPDSGTWTILVTLPDGRSCLVASGRNYEAITEPLPAKGDPA